MGDPERIWLQSADDSVLSWEGRLWCQDKVWPIDETEGEPTEYIRADLLSTACAEARREALEEMDAVLSSNQQLRSDLSRLRSEYDGLLKLWAQERDARSIVEAKLRKAYECQRG